MSPVSLPDDLANKVLQQLMDLYIRPAIEARQERGGLPRPVPLRAAQVVFYPDGRPAEVRINDEVRVLARVSMAPKEDRKIGDPVYRSEITSVQELKLTDQDDPDCGHATILEMNGSWTLVMDCTYNKATSRKYTDAAKEFLAAARYSFKHGNKRAFVDNLFSASELAAKASLLTYSGPVFRKRISRSMIHNRYNRYAKLGDAPEDAPKVFNKLSSWRHKARYLEGEFSISESEAKRWLQAVNSMIETAQVHNSK